VTDIRIERYAERHQAEMAERLAIRGEHPVYNIVRPSADG
jgi:hypothetical protein